MEDNLVITKHLNIFIDLIKKQFEYGGKKYALNNVKESTDELFDRFGFKWLLGTICKYLYRWNNLKREKDPLKIACYAFLLWIKRGYHIDNKRVIPIDTTLENKRDNFDNFIKIVKEHYYEKIYERYHEIDLIYLLSDLAKGEWPQISENNIIDLFFGAYFLWDNNFSNNPGKDMDINNEDE
jgi:hypothetical protein